METVKATADKIISFTLIIFFLALGVLGILLPLLPGLLFLFIAALIAARHFPAVAFCLERNRYCACALRYSNGFLALGWWDKTKLCFWGTVKLTVDGVTWTFGLLVRGIGCLKSRLGH